MFFNDQMYREVLLPHWPPRRIVSLVPSQTELLYALGLEQSVVGITKFCVHPPAWFRGKTHIGGTKMLNLDKIAALHPDLILGNKEENDRVQIEALAEHWPVWMSDVTTLTDACDMVLRIGNLTKRKEPARRLVAQIQNRFATISPPAEIRPSAAYFIWSKPYMVAATGTFIHNMLCASGFTNVFSAFSRYPEVTMDELAAAQPDEILLSSEPFPFTPKHFGVFREACPEARIRVVDGEMFSWYGSRLLEAPAYFEGLHKERAL